MESTFSQGDFIIVDKITPKYGDLEREDILVFVPEGKDVPFIKRVIGMGGETVVVKDGDVYVCGEDDLTIINDEVPDVGSCDTLEEWYLDPNTTTLANCNKQVFPIPEWAMFMVGDNRAHSTDSRCCFGSSCYDGANYVIYPKDIIGKVAVRLYPSIEKY